MSVRNYRNKATLDERLRSNKIGAACFAHSSTRNLRRAPWHGKIFPERSYILIVALI